MPYFVVAPTEAPMRFVSMSCALPYPVLSLFDLYDHTSCGLPSFSCFAAMGEEGGAAEEGAGPRCDGEELDGYSP